jgi:photosystem II stability/assembly factor-like uncharacterized protein
MRQFILTLTCFAAILSLTPNNALAGKLNPFTGSIGGSGLNNTTALTVNTNTYPVYAPSGSVNYSVIDEVVLKVDHASSVYVGTAYDYTFTLDITSWDQNNIPSNTTIDLRVAYDPTAATNYQDKSIYRFTDAQQVVVQVQQIYDNINNTSIADPADNLILEANILIERYYAFSTGTSIPGNVRHTVSANNSFLTFAWDYLPEAEDYEIEWTFVDDYDQPVSGSIPTKATSLVNYNFKNNSTRIKLSAAVATAGGTTPHYEIPLLYARGYIVYRVRAIGRDQVDPTKEIVGDWSLTRNSGTISSLSGSYCRVTQTHQKDMPWQLSSTYVEDGKKKEVIQYFDGTNRNRESVTKLSTGSQHTVVGTTIYDFEGRPAITTLPAPTTETDFKYYTNFNKTTLNQDYTKYQFDVDNGGTCGVTTPEMGTNAGASKYYSPDNPNKQDFQGNVPDAKRYPFTQVEYTPDNTGRIRRQGGAGKSLQLSASNGHETQYFYGQPNQVELDRLFGSDVGWKEHYKKNIVIDPNGQVSVSYLNKEGKVIATALAGGNPSSLIGLDNQTSQSILNEDLFGLDANGVSTLNKPDLNGVAVTFVTQIVVPITGPYTFSYDITTPQLSTGCFNANNFPVCFDCTYDMEISIIDQCGVNRFPTLNSAPYTAYVGSVAGSNHNLDDICGPLYFTNAPNNQTITLDRGTYLVSKTLTINRSDYEFYLGKYLESTCITGKQAFIDAELAKIDYSKCNLTFKDCIELLGTKDEYILSGKGTAEEWDAAYKECQSLRVINPDNEDGPCRSRYRIMLNDVSPSGQYGEYLDPSTMEVNADMHTLSVFNQNNKLPSGGNWKNPPTPYLDADGQAARVYISITEDGYLPEVDQSHIQYDGDEIYVSPQYLSHLEDFIRAWQPSWAASLVQYHPEYCYYLACLRNTQRNSGETWSSEEFDQVILSVNTYAEASDPNTYDFIDDVNGTKDLIQKDPFFKALPTSSPYYIAMRAYLDVALQHSNNPYTLKKFAAGITRCGNTHNSTASILDCGCTEFGLTPSCTPGSTGFTSTLLDDEWKAYRKLYLAKKQEIQEREAWESYFAQNPSCKRYNDCIGKENFNPFVTPLFNFWDLATWTYAHTSPQRYYPLDFSGWISQVPFLDASQPCGFTTWHLYKSKIRRFNNSTDLPKVDTKNTKDVDFNHYIETGQCPTTRDLQFFLNKMAMNGTGPGTSFLVNGGSLFHTAEFTKGLYEKLFQAGTSSYVEFAWRPTITGTQLWGQFEKVLTGTNDAVWVKLDLATASWNNVVGVQQLSYTYGDYNTSGSPPNIYHFKATVEVVNGSDIEYHTITGTTGFKINECFFTKQGEPNEFGSDLMNLMSVLASTGDLDNTAGVSLTSGSLPYNEHLTDLIKATIKPYTKPIDPYDWTYIPNTGYPAKFQINSTAHNNKLRIEFTNYTVGTGLSFHHNNPNSPSTNQYNLENLRYFDEINVDPANWKGGFVLHGYYGPTNNIAISYEITITGVIYRDDYVVSAMGTPGTLTNKINVGNWDYPIPISCKTVHHRTKNDLEPFLDDVFKNQIYEKYPVSSTISRYLNSSPKFTKLLKSYLGEKEYYIAEPRVIGNGLVADIMEHDGTTTIRKVCEVSLTFETDESAKGYQNIRGLTELKTDYSRIVDGYYYGFTANVYIGEASYKVQGYSTCFPLKECDAYCDNKAVSSGSGGEEGGDEGCEQKYNEYAGVWNGIQNTPVNPAGTVITKIPVLSYEYVLANNLCKCLDKYLKYLADKKAEGEGIQWVDGNYYNYTNIFNPAIPHGSSSQPVFPVLSLEKFVAEHGCSLGGDGWCAYEWEQRFCPPHTPPMGVNRKVKKEEPCKDYLESIATANGELAYKYYIQGLINDFEKQYYAKCLKPTEHFTMSYPLQEYQYTLYYYDQAGNLVRTVPPAGVRPLAPADLPAVKIDRTNNQRNIFPAHNLATTYQFNSLNQLTRQSTPDQEEIENWEVRSTTGLPSNITITGTYFHGAAIGYLTGNINGEGYIYVTKDAGLNWSRVQNFLVADLQKVFMVDGTTTGFAITNDGLLVKTVNGGTSWTLIPTSLGWTDPVNASNAPIPNDLYFVLDAGNLKGLVVGNNGFAQKTTDGGATWTTITFPGTPGNIISLDFSNVSDGTAISTQNGRSRFYKTSNLGTTWTEQTNIRVADLMSTFFTAAGTGYAGGKDGVLLKTTDGGNSWTQINSGLTKDIKKLHFFDVNVGLMLTSDGQLWSTANGGANWKQLTIIGQYNNFHFYSATNGYAVGMSGLISYIEMPTAATYRIIPVTNTITTDLYSVYFMSKGSGYVAGANGTLIYINAQLDFADKHPSTGIFYTVSILPYIPKANAIEKVISTWSTEKFVKIQAYVNGTSVVCHMLTETGKIIEWTNYILDPTGVPDASFVRIFSSATFADMHWTAGYDYAVTTANPGIVYKWGLTTACNTCSPVSTYTLPSTNFTRANSIFTWNDVTHYTVGQNGSINPYTSAGAVDKTLTVVPLPLNDIDIIGSSFEAYAVGVDGSIYHNVNYAGTGNWVYTPSGVMENLNAVRFLSSSPSTGAVVGDNGKILQTSNSAVSWSYPTMPVAAGAVVPKLTDIAIEGSTATKYYYASGNSGTLLKAITSLTAWESIKLPDDALKFNLKSVAADASGNIAVVGESGLFLNNPSGTWKVITDLTTNPIEDLNINSKGIGFAVGEKSLILKTIDGGASWRIMRPFASQTDLKAVQVISDNSAIIVGKSGTVRRTTDGGLTWGAAISGISGSADFNDAYLDDQKNGFIVGNSGTIYKAVAPLDGSTWTNMTSGTTQNLNAVYKRKNYAMACGAAGIILEYNTTTNAWTTMTNGGSNWTTNELFDIAIYDNNLAYTVGNNGTVLRFRRDNNTWTLKPSSAPNTSNTNNLYTLNFKVPSRSFIGGANGSLGARFIEDEIALFSTYFWYDKLGKQIINQNSKQFNRSPNKAYSYTRYDVLGRIIETGELETSQSINTILTTSGAVDPMAYENWIAAGIRKEVTKTYYDVALSHLSSVFTQENLRVRVASMTYEDVYDGLDNTYNSGTHYSYDIHGNVKVLVQENSGMAVYGTGEQYKRIEYEYDLVSGKVNAVHYQPGKSDQFHHRYEYDADNKITKVYTSRDGVSWDVDATYFYYEHGPLARVEIGDNKAQGIDYAYTLQGWIKGVNSDALNPERDMGKDGNNVTGNPNANFGRDLFGFSVGYYSNTTNKDYEAINWSGTGSVPAAQRFVADITGSNLAADRNDLYNGNITHMVTSLTDLNTGLPGIQGVAYKYDQLNRLKQTRPWSNIDISPNQNKWNSGGTYSGAYGEDFYYDPNGNITRLDRNGPASGLAMDNLVYQYNWINPANHSEGIRSNQLYSVDDNVSTSAHPEDIDDQNTNNYAYDESGNLIQDIAGEIQSINWTISGKIKKIQRTGSSTKSDLEFTYNPSGNRISKTVKLKPLSSANEEITYYVHDAQGNVMATYKKPLPANIYQVLQTLKSTVAPSTYQNFMISEFCGNSVFAAELVNRLAVAPDWLLMLKQSTQLAILCNDPAIRNYVRSALPDQQWVAEYYSRMGYMYLLDRAFQNNFQPLVSTYIMINPLFLDQMAAMFPADITQMYNFFFPGDPFGCGPDVQCMKLHLQTGVPPMDLANQLIAQGFSNDCRAVIDQVEAISIGSFWNNLQITYPWGLIISWIEIDRTTCGMYNDLLTWDRTWFESILASFPDKIHLLDVLRLANSNEFCQNALLYLESVYWDAVAAVYSKSQLLTAIENALGASVRNQIEAQLPDTYAVQEWYIYGSDRVGAVNYNRFGDPVTTDYVTGYFYRSLGYKRYEGKNNLGNVLAVFSDRVKPKDDNNNGIIDYRLGDGREMNDYYAFGSPIGSRTYAINGFGNYRFAFNGMEKTDEVYGGGNEYTTLYRQYDSRLGRWFSIDPEMLEKSYESPYSGMGNKPIWHNDPLGNSDDKPRQSNPNTTETLHLKNHGVKMQTKTKVTERKIFTETKTSSGEVIHKETILNRPYDYTGGTSVPQTVSTKGPDGKEINVNITFGPGFSSDNWQTPNNRINPCAVNGFVQGLQIANQNGANITDIQINATTNAHHDNHNRIPGPNWYRSNSTHYVLIGNARAIDIGQINGRAINASNNQATMLQNAFLKVSSVYEVYGPVTNMKGGVQVGNQGHNTWIHASFNH